MQTALSTPTGGDFDALERAVRETTRGRTFLDEYARRIRSTEMEKILSAVERLANSQQERVAASNLEVLRRELDTMAASISQTRREIAAIKPVSNDTRNDRISAATEELDFVVRSTERATADILSAAERIQAMSGEFKAKGVEGALCDELENHATNLMIACSFQDLTGQRMNKVVNTLRYLEQRVSAMIQIWGISPDDAKGNHPPMDTRPDAHLLNGPQRDGEGVNQDDVDRMLNEAAEAAPTTTSSQDDIDQLFG